jgi:two-component system NtrC family sensor kinase
MALRALVQRTYHAAKFAEIGLLAAGIIHEINNPVACIRSNITLLLQYLPHLGANGGSACEPEPASFVRDLHAILEDLAASIDLVTSITRNLKSLAYSAHDEPKDTDLHECIEAALRVANHELKYRVRVERDLGVVPRLVAYPGLLIQVFLNLFVNAAQAINGEGTLRIRTRCDGTDVLIEVADSGHGIHPEHLRRIFRPFFTTKPAGKGLGLGLSICKGIIERHGGDICASSSPSKGEGTMFRIKLPLVPAHSVPTPEVDSRMS